jgi:hypothetical protein
VGFIPWEWALGGGAAVVVLALVFVLWDGPWRNRGR